MSTGHSNTRETIAAVFINKLFPYFRFTKNHRKNNASLHGKSIDVVSLKVIGAVKSKAKKMLQKFCLDFLTFLSSNSPVKANLICTLVLQMSTLNYTNSHFSFRFVGAYIIAAFF